MSFVLPIIVYQTLSLHSVSFYSTIIVVGEQSCEDTLLSFRFQTLSDFPTKVSFCCNSTRSDGNFSASA